MEEAWADQATRQGGARSDSPRPAAQPRHKSTAEAAVTAAAVPVEEMVTAAGLGEGAGAGAGPKGTGATAAAAAAVAGVVMAGVDGGGGGGGGAGLGLVRTSSLSLEDYVKPTGLRLIKTPAPVVKQSSKGAALRPGRESSEEESSEDDGAPGPGGYTRAKHLQTPAPAAANNANHGAQADDTADPRSPQPPGSPQPQPTPVMAAAAAVLPRLPSLTIVKKPLE